MSKFQKMKVHSTTLNETFEVNVYEVTNAANNPCIVISHKSLETLAFQKNLEIGVKVIKAERDHAVVLAKLGTITKIGEAVTETLKGNVWPNYPVTCAMQRAQDRALIAYLQLPGDKPYYSSIENVEDNNIGPDVNLLTEQSKKFKINFGQYKGVSICDCPLPFLEDYVAGNIPGFQTADTMKGIIRDYLILVKEGKITHKAA